MNQKKVQILYINEGQMLMTISMDCITKNLTFISKCYRNNNLCQNT